VNVDMGVEITGDGRTINLKWFLVFMILNYQTWKNYATDTLEISKVQQIRLILGNKEIPWY
jgi:hypothetical protein